MHRSFSFLSLSLSLRGDCQNGMSVDLFLHCSLVPAVSTACVQTKLSPLKTNMQHFFLKQEVMLRTVIDYILYLLVDVNWCIILYITLCFMVH